MKIYLQFPKKGFDFFVKNIDFVLLLEARIRGFDLIDYKELGTIKSFGIDYIRFELEVKKFETLSML